MAVADEYTPTTEGERDGFALWLAAHDREVAAKAWDEGHRHPQRRDPDDGCRCGAWNEGECACGLYGSGRLLSLDDNPYREGGQ